MAQPVSNPKSIFRPLAAANYIGVSLRTLYRLAENDPSFPRKIIFTPRCVGFRRVDLDNYIQAKAEGL